MAQGVVGNVGREAGGAHRAVLLQFFITRRMSSLVAFLMLWMRDRKVREAVALDRPSGSNCLCTACQCSQRWSWNAIGGGGCQSHKLNQSGNRQYISGGKTLLGRRAW